MSSATPGYDAPGSGDQDRVRVVQCGDRAEGGGDGTDDPVTSAPDFRRSAVHDLGDHVDVDGRRTRLQQIPGTEAFDQLHRPTGRADGGDVGQFSGEAARSVQHLPVEHRRSADAGTEVAEEELSAVTPGPLMGLSQRRPVDVVVDLDRCIR